MKNSQFFSKTELILDFSVKVLHNPNIFTGKRLWWRFLFDEVAGLEFIPTVWLKKNSTTEVFEISEIFRKIYLHFLTNLLWVVKNIELTLNSIKVIYIA